MARSIQQSALRVHVALQLDDAPLSDALQTFVASGDAKGGDKCLQLLECGLNDWQTLVQLQRVLTALHRPPKLRARTLLRRDAKYDEWTLALGFHSQAEDVLWSFANALMLRLRSAGVVARVLLGPRVVLSLGSAFGTEQPQVHWEGESEWTQVVVTAVDESRTEMQRVLLQEAPVGDDLANLKYPGLVPVVDNMLSNNKDARKPIAVVLRGIPGSGKSTLGREIGAICRQKGVVFTACSADFTFETPRGYMFDAKKLHAAHSRCKRDFTRAIEENAREHVVLVDNTSTQMWEYEPYEEIARLHGCSFRILEMTCPDVVTAFRMGQRNSHGVPPDKVVSMFLRWEKDARAQCFAPQFEHAPLSANPLSDGKVGGLTYLGLFLDAKSKKKLLEQVPTIHSNSAADHVTLFYRPNKQYVRMAELGSQFVVRGVEVVQDGRGQTLRVELGDQLPLPLRNKIPHITLSTQSGVSAAYSNELLENKRASRSILDPPMQLKAHVGAALFVQNQRVITTSSPFAVESSLAQESPQANPNNPHEEDSRTNLFILCVGEGDLTEETEANGRPRDASATKLLLRAQIQHHIGSSSKLRRLVCVQRSHASSSISTTALLRNLHGFLLSPYIFDDIAVIPTVDPFQTFEGALGKYQRPAGFGRITMLTTLPGAQWLLRWVEYLKGTTVSIIRLGSQPDSVHPLTPRCPSVMSILDLLEANIQEQTRSVALHGVDTVRIAWAGVRKVDIFTAEKEVRRVDTTLPGMGSDVIEICVVLPTGSDPSEVSSLQELLICAIQRNTAVRHLAASCILGKFYFSLCGVGSYSPVFCVHMVSPTEIGAAAAPFKMLTYCENQLQTSRADCEVEVYSVLTPILRNILWSGCVHVWLPSECSISPLVNLVSERLVLVYLQHLNSTSKRATAAEVESGRIIFTLYDMLTYLSTMNGDHLVATLGDSLLDLQGNENAQSAWREAIASILHQCRIVLDSYHCVGMGDTWKGSASLNAAHHLDVLMSLLKTIPTGNAAPVRTYLELPSRQQWNVLHSHALCDRLKTTAATLISQLDDGRNAGDTIFFSCAPGQIARRIDMTSSSFDVVVHVMMTLRGLDDGSHFDGVLPKEYVIRRAETDEALGDAASSYSSSS